MADAAALLSQAPTIEKVARSPPAARLAPGAVSDARGRARSAASSPSAAAKRSPIGARARVRAGPDHPAAGDHHVAPRRGRAAEDERVERALRRARRAAHRRADRRPARRRARRRRVPTPARRPRAAPPASVRANEPLGARRDAELGRRRRRCARAAPGAGRIRAGAAPRASRASPGCRSRSSSARRRRASRAGRRGRRRGWPRCSGTARRRRRSPRPPRSPARVACVAWTSCQRASSTAFANEPFDRPRAGRGEAARRPRAVCSATWMWIGPAKPSASVAQRRDRRRARGAQRVDREAGVERAAARRRGCVAAARTSRPRVERKRR